MFKSQSFSNFKKFVGWATPLWTRQPYVKPNSSLDFKASYILWIRNDLRKNASYVCAIILKELINIIKALFDKTLCSAEKDSGYVVDFRVSKKW
jgi:hypothetical protein